MSFPDFDFSAVKPTDFTKIPVNTAVDRVTKLLSDVELRKEMWDLVARLKEGGVTIILTTHYIEEAEAIADRIGVINKGALLLVEPTAQLMQRLGKKELQIDLAEPMSEIPASLSSLPLEIGADGSSLVYTYDTTAERTGITHLLSDLSDAGLVLRDLQTRQSSLEDIFVDLVAEERA